MSKDYREMSNEEKVAAFEEFEKELSAITSLLQSPDENTDTNTAEAVAELMVKKMDESEEEEEGSPQEAIIDFLEHIAQVARDLRDKGPF